jgi:hypothetical protein
MTCHDCELLLSRDEISVEARQHVNACAACCSLADEISANAAVLREFRDEVLPFHAPAVAPAPRPSWKWAALVPAFVVLLAVLLRWNASHALPRTMHATTQKPLMVKMLTSDPTVVIYWQIDPNNQEQQ